MSQNSVKSLEAKKKFMQKYLLPKICEKYGIHAEYVLYTDCDVIFMKDPIDELSTYKPMYFACCSEINSSNFEEFN